MFHANILTLFPEMFPGPLGASLAGKALEAGRWQMDVLNIRDFAEDRHKSVDDAPYGGGAGMVMRPDIVGKALDMALSKQPKTRLLYFSPRGRVMDQALVEELVEQETLTLLCGRYEGLDQRVIDHYAMEEVSVGDFILSGGEMAALLLLDACVRRLPGVVGNEATHEEESFGQGETPDLLEYPLYTRPQEWRGLEVPAVLSGGNHAEINAWRQRQAEEVTKARRPDLWQKYLASKREEV